MRNIVPALCVASLVTVGVAAQGQQPPAQGEQPTVQREQPATKAEQPAAQREQSSAQAEQPVARGQQAATQAGKVTISGCIQAAPAPAAAAGAPSAKPAESKFELANAKTLSDRPVGTTGATPVVRYRLEGEETIISPHMNHQVDITGTVSPASASGAATPTAAPMLKVESVKMIAAKCE